MKGEKCCHGLKDIHHGIDLLEPWPKNNKRLLIGKSMVVSLQIQRKSMGTLGVHRRSCNLELSPEGMLLVASLIIARRGTTTPCKSVSREQVESLSAKREGLGLDTWIELPSG